MLCFPDTKPRTCCCGCSIACGVWFFIIICALEAVSCMSIGWWTFCVLNAIPAITGAWTMVQKDNIMARTVNFYVWCAINAGYVIFCAVFLFMGANILEGLCEDAGGVDCNGIGSGLVWGLFAWMMIVGLPTLLLGLGVSWSHLEEGKEEQDSGYTKAG